MESKANVFICVTVLGEGEGEVPRMIEVGNDLLRMSLKWG